MHSNLKAVAAIVAGLAATASAITGPGDFCYGNYFSMYNRGGPSLSYQRIDPALNPGVESPHLHSFDGGNNIGASIGSDDLLASTCTTAKMKQDKSLYWNPTLHFQNSTGFYRVPEMYKKVYYKFGEGSNNIKASAFPKDFMMIAGSSSARSEGDMVSEAGVSWACLRDEGRIDTTGFPTGFTACNQGFATQLTFPACWNGDKINPEKPTAHMAYPTGGIGTDGCPAGFQVARFPTIFVEFWWDIGSFVGSFGSNDTPWVLSNGDPTGMGFHADFAMGWEDGVLEKAISDDQGLKCGCGCGDDEFNAYFGEENVNTGDEWNKCTATSEFPGDDKELLEKLPGCNPLQYGPAKATVVTGAGCSVVASSTPKASVSKAATPAASSAASSIDAVSSAYTSKATSIEAANVSSAAASAFSISLPGKGVGEAPTTTPTTAYTTGGASFVFLSEASSTPAGETTVAVVESSAAASGPVATSPPEVPYSASSPEATSKPEVPYGASSVVDAVSSAAALPTFPSEGGCKAPIYVTVTPTVYVTAGAGDCGGTIYKTVTNTATVTVSPTPGGYKHKHRRHLKAHLHKH